MARVSDKRVLELGRQYDEVKTQLLDALKARAKAGRPTTVEADGVKVNLRVNVTKHWDVKGLAAKLTRAVKAKVIVTKVDGRQLAAAVRRGEVDQALVDEHITGTTESAPFVEVTVKS